MSIKYITAGKAVALVAAGKLAISSNAVLANGKDAEFVQAEQPPLHLNEIGTPLSILQPPGEEFKDDLAGINVIDSYTDSGSKNTSGGSDDTGGKTTRTSRATGGKTDPKALAPDQQLQTAFDPEGVIFAGEIQKNLNNKVLPHVSFIVSGIPNKPSMVFLAYSLKKGEPAFWENQFGKIKAGKIGLALDFKLLAGIQIEPETRLPTANDVGEIATKTRSAVIDIALKKIAELPSNMIHFQAVTLPAGAELDFSNAQASEIDSFFIVKPPKDAQGNYLPNGGSKQDSYNTGGVVKPKTPYNP